MLPERADTASGNRGKRSLLPYMVSVKKFFLRSSVFQAVTRIRSIGTIKVIYELCEPVPGSVYVILVQFNPVMLFNISYG